MKTRLLIFAILCSGLWAQEDGIPVVVDGREVVRVYSSVGSFSAKDRVSEIERRIELLGEKGFAGGVTTRPIPSEKATAVVAGGVLVMAVTTADAELAGIPREELAQKYAGAIQKAIEGYRVRHSWSSFLMGILKTLVAWILALK
jgi:hypothetical protein